MTNLSRAVVLLFLFLPVLPIQAASPLDIMINEISWMGEEKNGNDEWLELYNSTNLPISLDGWSLKAADGTPEIKLSGEISANGFYLLERTDDDSVPGIPADQIYKGALENNGENLELYDDKGNLVDFLDCSSKWSAGDNITKQTMERIDSKNWQNSKNAGGTPKAKNGIINTAESGSQSSSTPTQEKSKSLAYPSGIVINEILPSPEGKDSEEEWLEIFNQNDLETSLADWKISDITGVVKTYTFPEETKIPAKEFLVLTRPVSKITLNNEGDGLKLIRPDGKTVDSVEYVKAPKGQSFNRTAEGWVWSDILTPGSLNEDSETEPGVGTIKTDETNPEFQVKEGLAAVSQSFEKSQRQKIPNSFPPYLIAVSLAVFSGAVIFSLKRLISSKN